MLLVQQHGGGVVGGATLISGGIDAYHAIKSDEAAEKKAYGTSAGLKVGGVAGGAALGAAIGSVIPGLGTVVGGLIGAESVVLPAGSAEIRSKKTTRRQSGSRRSGSGSGAYGAEIKVCPGRFPV